MGRQLGGKPTCIHTICGLSRCYWIHTMPETLGWVFLVSFCFLQYLQSSKLQSQCHMSLSCLRVWLAAVYWWSAGSEWPCTGPAFMYITGLTSVHHGARFSVHHTDYTSPAVHHGANPPPTPAPLTSQKKFCPAPLNQQTGFQLPSTIDTFLAKIFK